MTRAEARWLAEGHIIRVIEGALHEGWPAPADFGYTEEDAAMVRHELETWVAELAAR